MNKRLLLVEDRDIQRKEYTAALRKRGLTVDAVPDGEAALQLLRKRTEYAAMILDLYLPGKIQGFDVIDLARTKGYPVPPVVVVSAHVTDAAWQRFVELEIDGLLPKPVPAALLAGVLEYFCKGDERALVNLPSVTATHHLPELQVHRIEYKNKHGYIFARRTALQPHAIRKMATVRQMQSVSDKTRERESQLKEYFIDAARQPSGLPQDEPLLVVGRRWNSWYPSFFDVIGGAYAVVGAKGEGVTPAVLIDPGFRALEAMRRLDVHLEMMRTCVVTHNHPDHIGGIPEYVTGRHVLGDDTVIYCGKSCLGMLDTYRGMGMAVRELDTTTVDAIAPYLAAERRRITATPFPTSHLDTGSKSGTCGLLLGSDIEKQGSFRQIASAVIVGDTEYHSARNHPNAGLYKRIKSLFARPDLKVAVLHIGCSQLREGTGKHLYLQGLVDLLKDAEAQRRKHADGEPLLVLVSEWGLEHATARQIERAISHAAQKRLVQSFGQDNLILETMEVVERCCGLDHIRLLPADTGLVVGMETGRVYLKGSDSVRPEDVVVEAGPDGLVYKKARRKSAGA